MPYPIIRALVATVAVGAAACANEPEEPPAAAPRAVSLAGAQDMQDPFRLSGLRDVVSAAQPPAFAQVGADMTVRFLGKGTLVSDPPATPRGGGAEAPNTGAVSVVPVERLPAGPGEAARFHLFNSATRNEFEVVVSGRLLASIHAAREQAGLTGALRVDEPASVEDVGRPAALRLSAAAAPPTVFAWSGGVDNRALLTPTTTSPWRTVAQLTYSSDQSGCSATLIGPRHLITAAHCLVNAGSSNWKIVSVAPARDGVANRPFGSSTVSLNPPAGKETWYFTPARWCDPKVADVRPFDWGLVVIPDRLGDFTGWMGYVAKPADKLANSSHFNRGYPSCDPANVDRPANCQKARMYGDSGECELGNYESPDADGWNRLASHSCDVSKGHDGGALYHYFFDSAVGTHVPVVSLVTTTQDCTKCSASTTLPARAHRLTPSDLTMISWLRQTFP